MGPHEPSLIHDGFVCLLYSFRERSVCAFVCHGVHVDIRVQLAGVDFLLPLDSGGQILAIRLMWGALSPSGTTMERWCAPIREQFDSSSQLHQGHMLPGSSVLPPTYRVPTG